MSWNEAARLQANKASVKQYGAWVPSDEDARHPTLRKVLEHMLISLPDEALETFFGYTDMTFVAAPSCQIDGIEQEGFVAWKVWYVGENNGTKPLEESPQRDTDEERVRDEDRRVPRWEED